jgi:hypothetical protein
MTQSTISSGQDVVTFLRGQHEQIKNLFSHVKSTSGAQREEAVHGVAEAARRPRNG